MQLPAWLKRFLNTLHHVTLLHVIPHPGPDGACPRGAPRSPAITPPTFPTACPTAARYSTPPTHPHACSTGICTSYIFIYFFLAIIILPTLHLSSGLTALAREMPPGLISDVRGRGLMVGVEFGGGGGRATSAPKGVASVSASASVASEGYGTKTATYQGDGDEQCVCECHVHRAA